MVEKGIQARLLTEASFGEMDIYFGVNPNLNQSTALAFRDYIVHFRLGTEPHDTKTGRSQLDEVSYQVNIFASNAVNLANYAETVRGNLDRYSGTAGDVVIQSIQFENQVSMFDYEDTYNKKGIYQMVQYYKIRTEPQYQ